MRRVLRENPHRDSPERRGTVIRRLTLGLGGLTLTVGMAFQAHHENLSGADNYLSPLGLTGIGAAAIALALEIAERYPRDGGDGGPYKKWEPPQLPPDPDQPGIDPFIEQIEALLKEHAGQPSKELVSV
jgi:hypothetical protein